MKTTLTAAVLSLLMAGAVGATAPTLYQQPALSRTHIVFQYAGDLWMVGREGGDARRLTAHPGQERDPFFSPDGQWVAFTGEYDGSTDVFVVPASGGVPRRLTWHPDIDTAAGWTRDGASVLMRSTRHSYSRFRRLFTMPLAGGVLPEEAPLPTAEQGSFSPDGTRIAYTPLNTAFATWKRYRGGRTTPIWIARLSDSTVEARIPRQNSSDFNPMWIEDRIWFLSDRNGPATLFSYDLKSQQVTEAIDNTGLDLKWASAGPGAIAYEQFGSIWLFDLKTRKPRPVAITLSGDLAEVRPRIEKLTRLSAGGLSPNGARAVFEARGEVLTVPAEKGDVRNLTGTSGAAERDPAWSPDGKWIAYFSDVSGEYEMHVAGQSGLGEIRKFRLGATPHFYSDPLWSPDSGRIAYTDETLSLYYLDLASRESTLVDTDRHNGPRRLREAAWSPDSRWLTYTKQMASTLRAVYIYSLQSRDRRQVTDGMSDAFRPVFDRDGKYLYFLASTNTGLNVGWRDMSAFNHRVTSNLYAVVLRNDLPSPVAPESDEEKAPEPAKPESKEPAAAKPAEVRIDFDDIGDRIVALPPPTRVYTGLETGKAGIVYLTEVPAPDAEALTIQKFDLKTRKTDKLLESVLSFHVAAGGEKVLYRRGAQWFISSASEAPKPGAAALKMDGMEARVDPRAEWRQMFQEAWRLQRDFFYEPGLHGVDIEAMKRRYEPYLAAVASRGDLNYLFSEMMGEFTISHLYVSGGQTPEVKRVPGGLLGAEYRIENGRYRFARIYTGENWNPGFRAPLTEPGARASAGEYLLAVNGRDLPASGNIFQFFEGTADKQVVLKVGPDPGGAGSREIVVRPVASESRLRYLAWIEENRRRVDKLSGGRLAYVHLPDTSGGGYTNFNRYYFAQVGKQGAVLDERFNGGGAQPDYIVDYLNRPLLHYRNMRYGEDVTGPLAGIFGPKAMLINEDAGSGGDTLPWYFRKAKVGPLVGKRTWGGLVGGLGGYPQLIDGGSVSVPQVGFWDPEKREWVAENTGIAPDFEVEMDPKAAREGRDPQLEKAVEVVLEALAKNPPPKHERPAFPKYQR